MPVQTEIVIGSQRERNQTAVLRQQIRKALVARGRVHTKRAVRARVQEERSNS